MSNGGLIPTEDYDWPKYVSPERLAEFDRLMAEGGIEAIMEKLLFESLRAVLA